jgi:hypothetical protein
MEAIAHHIDQLELQAVVAPRAPFASAAPGTRTRRDRAWPVMIVLTGLALNVVWCGFLAWEATGLLVGLIYN